MHPVTEQGARGVQVYLPGKGEVSWRGLGGHFLYFFVGGGHAFLGGHTPIL